MNGGDTLVVSRKIKEAIDELERKVEKLEEYDYDIPSTELAIYLRDIITILRELVNEIESIDEGINQLAEETSCGWW